MNSLIPGLVLAVCLGILGFGVSCPTAFAQQVQPETGQNGKSPVSGGESKAATANSESSADGSVKNGPAPESGNELLGDRVVAGLAGVHKLSKTFGVRVDVRPPSGSRNLALVASLPDADDGLVRYATELPGDKSGPVTVIVRSGKFDAPLTLELVERTGATERVLASKTYTPQGSSGWTAAIRPNVPVWLTLGELPGFSAAEQSAEETGESDTPPVQIVAIDDPTLFPQTADELQSADAVVIALGARFGASGIPANAAAAIAAAGDPLVSKLSPRQFEALREFVYAGGSLMLSVTPDPAAWSASPLSRWCPWTATDKFSTRRLVSLESYSKREIPLVFRGSVEGLRISVQTGKNIVNEIDGPMVVRASYGFGTVTGLSVDLASPPLSTWKGLPAVCRRAISETRIPGRSEKQTVGQQLARSGVSDISTQLALSLQQVTASRSGVTFWTVMGLIAAYAVVIGPIDRLFTGRVLRRPEWTWLTLPIWVLTATVLTSQVISSSTVSDTQMPVSRLNVVDIDTATGGVKGRTWLAIQPGGARRLNLEVRGRRWTRDRVVGKGIAPAADAGKPAAEVDGKNARKNDTVDKAATAADAVNPAAASETTVAGRRLDWLSVPENSLGGLYRGSGWTVAGRSMTAGVNAAKLDNVPTRPATTQMFEAKFEYTTDDVVVSDLESDSFGRITGSFTQRLGVDLNDFLFVYGNRVYVSKGGRPLRSEFAWQPSGTLAEQRNLRDFLNGSFATEKTTKFGKEIVFRTQVYDPLSLDVKRLMNTLSLYTAAGGAGYTGISNSLMTDMDLTPLTNLNSGVLIGWVNASASTLLVNGAELPVTEERTLVRFKIPIKQLQETPAARGDGGRLDN